MKLVIRFAQGDNCTWWATAVHPVEYDSAEQFVIDYEEWLNSNKDVFLRENEYFMKLLDNNPETFQSLEVLTVDEWFSKYGTSQ